MLLPSHACTVAVGGLLSVDGGSVSASGIDVRTVGVGSTIGVGRSENNLMGALTIIV